MQSVQRLSECSRGASGSTEDNYIYVNKEAKATKANKWQLLKSSYGKLEDWGNISCCNHRVLSKIMQLGSNFRSGGTLQLVFYHSLWVFFWAKACQKYGQECSSGFWEDSYVSIYRVFYKHEIMSLLFHVEWMPEDTRTYPMKKTLVLSVK